MEINRVCNHIRDNLSSLQKSVGVTTPTTRPRASPVCFESTQSPIVRPRASPVLSQPKRHRQSDSMSIEDDSNIFSSPFPKYPCFKCHISNNAVDVKGSTPLCQECDGSELISETHPMACLLSKILNAKIAPMLERQKEQENQRRRSELRTECKNCRRALETQDLYYCDSCIDYTLCVSCYQHHRALHVPGHFFIRRNAKSYMIKIKQKLPTMKKISEQFESEEGGATEEDLHCSVCLSDIEECYEVCEDCGSKGKKFLLCNQCSNTHNHTHRTTMKTVSKGSMLEMMKPPSSEIFGMVESMEYQIDADSINSPKKPKEQKNVTQSIVFLPQVDIEESSDLMEESHPTTLAPPKPPSMAMEKYETDSFSFEDCPRFNPETTEPTSPKSVRQNPSSSHLRMDSVVNIDMQQELEQFPIYNESAPSSNRPSAMKRIMAKDRSRASFVSQAQQDYVFNDYQCDICGNNPHNMRYHCQICEDYDICEECYHFKSEEHPHKEYEEIDGRQILRERAKKALGAKRISLGTNDIGRSSIRSSIIA